MEDFWDLYSGAHGNSNKHTVSRQSSHKNVFPSSLWLKMSYIFYELIGARCALFLNLEFLKEEVREANAFCLYCSAESSAQH